MFSKNDTNTNDDIIATYLHFVKSFPDKLAVIDEHAQITYSSFNQKVNRLAKALKMQYSSLLDAATQPVLIGVMCHNKVNALICELALLKLNLAFVPFSFKDPVDRIQFMQKKSGTPLILTDGIAPIFNDVNSYHVGEVLEEREVNEFVADEEVYTEIKAKPGDLAYVLFTSGSTAQNPKGVMQTRHGLIGQIINYTKDLRVSANDCVLNLAVFTHDQAIVDCFAALLNGCSLCLFELGHINITEIHKFINQNKVSIFSSIPSLFSTVFENINNKNHFPHLRIVTIGGEETKLSHAELYQRTCPDTCLLVNGYGATEISWISSFNIDSATDLKKFNSIPLGYVTSSVELKLEAEEDGHYELCVSSDSLAIGYLGDEEATKKAFFTSNDNVYYRTGDIVSLQDDGCMIFSGRKSWHEKIQGKRVNLHEIENLLKEIGYGDNCVVLAYGENERKRLYGFYFGAFVSIDNSQLRSKLPQYMIPREMIHLSEMPTLPNGKVDRQELLKRLKIRQDESKVKLKNIQESNVLSEVVKSLWCDVLDLSLDTGLTGISFEEMGGNSILATKLTNTLNEYIKQKNNVPELFFAKDLFSPQTNQLGLFTNYVDELLIQTQTRNLTKASQITKIPVTYEIGMGMDSEQNQITFMQPDPAGLKILVNHFNQLYNIHISLYEKRHEEIIDYIDNFISDNSNDLSQVGMLLPYGEDECYDPHLIPSVLCKDSIANKYVLLIADSSPQGLNRAMGNDRILTKIKTRFPNLELHYDLNGMQKDYESCTVFALLYLIDALRLDMLKNIKEDTIGGPKILEDFHYLSPDTRCFISPPELFKSSQKDFPQTIAQDTVLIFDSSGRSLKQFVDDNTVAMSGRNQFQKINTYAWKKSHEFNYIIKDKINSYLEDIILNKVFDGSHLGIMNDLYYYSVDKSHPNHVDLVEQFKIKINSAKINFDQLENILQAMKQKKDRIHFLSLFKDSITAILLNTMQLSKMFTLLDNSSERLMLLNLLEQPNEIELIQDNSFGLRNTLKLLDITDRSTLIVFLKNQINNLDSYSIYNIVSLLPESEIIEFIKLFKLVDRINFEIFKNFEHILSPSNFILFIEFTGGRLNSTIKSYGDLKWLISKIPIEERPVFFSANIELFNKLIKSRVNFALMLLEFQEADQSGIIQQFDYSVYNKSNSKEIIRALNREENGIQFINALEKLDNSIYPIMDENLFDYLLAYLKENEFQIIIDRLGEKIKPYVISREKLVEILVNNSEHLGVKILNLLDEQLMELISCEDDFIFITQNAGEVFFRILALDIEWEDRRPWRTFASYNSMMQLTFEINKHRATSDGEKSSKGLTFFAADSNHNNDQNFHNKEIRQALYALRNAAIHSSSSNDSFANFSQKHLTILISDSFKSLFESISASFNVSIDKNHLTL